MGRSAHRTYAAPPPATPPPATPPPSPRRTAGRVCPRTASEEGWGDTWDGSFSPLLSQVLPGKENLSCFSVVSVSCFMKFRNPAKKL